VRVLLTIQVLEGRAGASLYVRDCALELLRQGHQPVVFSTRLGALAAEMRSLTIPVIDRLDMLTAKPDVIHGNSPIETVAAMLFFPDTPAIYVCHAWDNPDSLPPKMPGIVRYLAVDHTCRDHLVCQMGIRDDQVLVRFNGVDLDRFPQRPPLPERAGQALIFSNSASEENYVPAVRQACAQYGITLDVLGESSNGGCSLAKPEEVLRSYDIVFAKARCALEALATGAAVIVCDAGGMGPLVTTDNLETLRQKNFGRRALQNPISAASVADEIMKYDREDAARVTALVRASGDLANATRSLVAIYHSAIEDFRSGPAANWERARQAASDFLQTIAPFSNTFNAADRLRAAHGEIQSLRRKLGGLEDLLRMAPLTAVEQRQIRVLGVVSPSTVSAGELFRMIVELDNGSSRFLASHPPFPVYLSYHWLNADRSTLVCFEGLRSPIAPALPPGERHHYSSEVISPEKPGRYWLRAAFVQEQVNWSDMPEWGQFADAQVTVN
jgi:hypothetical protein